MGAQRGMQARRSAGALTELGPIVAGINAAATGVMILGCCKTARTPRRWSCLRHRPKPHGIAQRGMQARRSAGALTKLGPIVARVNATATIAGIGECCVDSEQFVRQLGLLAVHRRPAEGLFEFRTLADASAHAFVFRLSSGGAVVEAYAQRRLGACICFSFELGGCGRRSLRSTTPRRMHLFFV